MLGLEKGREVDCFQKKIGLCKGACINEESPILYNTRFSQAFSKKRISRWPFSGAIVIEEHDLFYGKVDYYIFNDWCYLGKAANEEELYEDILKNQQSFDYDLYMILKNYLRSEKVVSNIKVISNI